jgi:phosphoglycolate phosphatase
MQSEPEMSQNTCFQGIVFDFDGTLAELNIDFGLMKRGIVALATAFLEQPFETDSLPALELLDLLAKEVGKQDQALGLELHSRGRLLITTMELEASGRGRLFPSTRQVLGTLAGRGVATAVITRNCTAAVKRLFPDIEEACGCFLARDSVPNPKPHPAHVRLACERIGVAPERTLVVGDHPMDIETAQRVGAMSAAVASGRISLEELKEHRPDYLATDCEALVRMLIKEGRV